MVNMSSRLLVALHCDETLSILETLRREGLCSLRWPFLILFPREGKTFHRHKLVPGSTHMGAKGRGETFHTHEWAPCSTRMGAKGRGESILNPNTNFDPRLGLELGLGSRHGLGLGLGLVLGSRSWWNQSCTYNPF